MHPISPTVTPYLAAGDDHFSPAAATRRTAYLERAAASRSRSGVRAAAACQQAPHGLPTYSFLLCSANRHHYLPTHSTTDAEFYEQVIQYRDWASMDEHEEEAYLLTRFTGDTSFLADIQARPRVFCTLHLGSYRLINHFLCRHAVPFTLVIDNATLQEQGDKFLAMKAADSASNGGSFRILNAESASIGLQMIREVKAGRSLLFYIDGNTGVSGMDRRDEKLTVVPFLKRQVFARKGIAFLAHVTGSPIVPLVAYRHGDADFETRFFSPIIPDAGQPRDEFAVNTTRRIFELFEPALRRYPTQWEGWLYMNRFVDLSALREQHDPQPNLTLAPIDLPTQPVFNHARYSLFVQADQSQLFDRLTYQTFNVSGQLVKLLQNLPNLPSNLQQQFASMPIFKDLCARQVIVATPVA